MTFYDYMTSGSSERCPGLQFNMKKTLTVGKHTHSRSFIQKNNKRNSLWLKIEEKHFGQQGGCTLFDNLNNTILAKFFYILIKSYPVPKKFFRRTFK